MEINYKWKNSVFIILDSYYKMDVMISGVSNSDNKTEVFEFSNL